MENIAGDIAPGGTKTILIADDEKILRDILSRLFISSGYDVILAEDGDDAVEKYKQNSGNISIVVMDIVMPRKDGILAYLEIKEVNPDAAILFMSGYGTSHLQVLAGLGIATPELIAKPFEPAELLYKITSLLNN